MASETLKLTPSESVRIVRSEPEVLEVEATYAPKGKPPPRHLHPQQDEHFEVLEGVLRVRTDGDERVLRAGERIDIPRGTSHQMWNAESARTRVRWETRPRGRTEEWFRGIDAAQPEGSGSPGPLALAVLLDEYDDTFRLALSPGLLVKGTVAGLAAVGRLLGRRPEAG